MSVTKKGSCLCGALQYEISGKIDGVWLCHCSNCQKASGNIGNAIIPVPKDNFRWLKGRDHLQTYHLRSTYSITRCKTCGTPLPAEEDEATIYLTAGTLDEAIEAGVKTHIFYASRAAWEDDQDGACYYDGRPPRPSS